MTATDELRRMLDERGVEWEGTPGVTFWGNCSALDITTNENEKVHLHMCCTPEQAIAATLGKQKATAHPYGYEPDTGAFDVTRCECGCLNDISATYCNDCGGEIEVDMNAEKLRDIAFRMRACAMCNHAQEVEAIAATLEEKSNGETSRYFELFGTPEKAARTLHELCGGCCGLPERVRDDYDALLEWLRGDA